MTTSVHILMMKHFIFLFENEKCVIFSPSFAPIPYAVFFPEARKKKNLFLSGFFPKNSVYSAVNYSKWADFQLLKQISQVT